MYFFTADEHYGHKNVIKYEDRPFKNIEEMDKILIENNNEIVTDNDVVVHAGDFSFYNKEKTYRDIITKLKGNHIFLEGNHDRWLKSKQLWQKRIGEYYIVVCHYAMRTWPRSHYGSIQLYGHSHGHLPPEGKQMDIGVDTNNFYPYHFSEIVKIIEKG